MQGKSTKGKDCENLVSDSLIKDGYTVVSQNFRGRYGEIDIIVSKDNELCFVEVKAFPSAWPEEDMTLKVPVSKQVKIKRTACEFLETQQHIKYDNLRFDVAAVRDNKILYYKGAF